MDHAPAWTGRPDDWPQWMKDLLVTLLFRNPETPIDEPPEWFMDAWPEPYMEFTDRGLLEGMWTEYRESEVTLGHGRTVTLSPAGREIAVRFHRELRSRLVENRTAGSVFVSYVREDTAQVDALCGHLEAAGVRTWRDVDRLLPGTDWKDAVTRAIRNGTGFIGCFSPYSESQQVSYMREELLVAVEELRKKPLNCGWFIPVKLGDCEIPSLPLGAGRSLQDLQHVDLRLEDGTNRLIEAIAELEGVAP